MASKRVNQKVDKELSSPTSIGNFILPIVYVNRTIPYKQGSIVWDPLQQKVFISNGTAWNFVETSSSGGDVIINGNLHVDGTLTINDNVLLNAILTALGNATFQGTLDVTGDASFITISSSGNVTIGGTLGVSTLASLGSLDVTGNASVGGTLDVTGDMTVANAQVTGTLTIPPRAINSYRVSVYRAIPLGTSPTTLSFTVYLDPGSAPAWFDGVEYTAMETGIYNLSLTGDVAGTTLGNYHDLTLSVQVDQVTPVPATETRIAFDVQFAPIKQACSLRGSFSLMQGQKLRIYMTIPPSLSTSSNLYLTVFRIE